VKGRSGDDHTARRQLMAAGLSGAELDRLRLHGLDANLLGSLLARVAPPLIRAVLDVLDRAQSGK
jgi:hypothetical protein